MYVLAIKNWKKKLALLVGMFVLSCILIYSYSWWNNIYKSVVSDKLEDEVLSEPLKVQSTTIKK